MLRLLVILGCAVVARVVDGAVIVVANRADAEVVFAMAPEAPSALRPLAMRLPPRQTVPILATVPAELSFTSGEARKTLRVLPDHLYYFGEKEKGHVELVEIGLSVEVELSAKAASAAPSREPPAVLAAGQPSLVIPVKVLYDDAERSPRETWDRRIRARFDKASRIFKQHCFVEFKIVAIDHWASDDSLKVLDDAMRQFEQSVEPSPARLAIGFTAQQRLNPHPADRLMAGTRGPLHSHLLVREWVNHNSEPERLEVLCHELGHFLGAVHSPEWSSVMRAALGDRQARRTKFTIGFDPLNTLAMCLVSQELRGGVAMLGREVSPPEPPALATMALGTMPLATRLQLLRIYAEMARATPRDPTAPSYLRRVLGAKPQTVEARQP